MKSAYGRETRPPDYELICVEPGSTRPTAPDDLGTEMAEEEGSEMAGSARTSPMDRQPYLS
jgi:hypothetical protein